MRLCHLIFGAVLSTVSCGSGKADESQEWEWNVSNVGLRLALCSVEVGSVELRALTHTFAFMKQKCLSASSAFVRILLFAFKASIIAGKAAHVLIILHSPLWALLKAATIEHISFTFWIVLATIRALILVCSARIAGCIAGQAESIDGSKLLRAFSLTLVLVQRLKRLKISFILCFVELHVSPVIV